MFGICRKPLYLGPELSWRTTNGRETYDQGPAERFASEEAAQNKINSLEDKHLWMPNLLN